MNEALARIRPRGRHDVEVRLAPQGTSARIILRREGEPLPLTAVGYFAFLQMDGETRLETVLERIHGRFGEAEVGLENLARLVERLADRGLLFEDQRVVRARAALRQSGIEARRERAPVAADGSRRRQNDDVAGLVHDGWAALVGSEFPRAVSKFRSASERLPASLRLASFVDVLERVAAGEEEVGGDPWIGIERVLRRAIEEKVCPACGAPGLYAEEASWCCQACGGQYQL